MHKFFIHKRKGSDMGEVPMNIEDVYKKRSCKIVKTTYKNCNSEFNFQGTIKNKVSDVDKIEDEKLYKKEKHPPSKLSNEPTCSNESSSSVNSSTNDNNTTVNPCKRAHFDYGFEHNLNLYDIPEDDELRFGDSKERKPIFDHEFYKNIETIMSAETLLSMSPTSLASIEAKGYSQLEEDFTPETSRPNTPNSFEGQAAFEEAFLSILGAHGSEQAANHPPTPDENVASTSRQEYYDLTEDDHLLNAAASVEECSSLGQDIDALLDEASAFYSNDEFLTYKQFHSFELSDDQSFIGQQFKGKSCTYKPFAY